MADDVGGSGISFEICRGERSGLALQQGKLPMRDLSTIWSPSPWALSFIMMERYQEYVGDL